MSKLLHNQRHTETAPNREGYSKKFYDRNVEALQRVIANAAAWIQEHPEAADGPVAESASELQAAA